MRAGYAERKAFLTSRLRRLKQSCDEASRRYEEIERIALGPIRIARNAMNTTELIELCRESMEIGIQHYIFSMSNAHEIEPIEVIGRHGIPAVASLT